MERKPIGLLAEDLDLLGEPEATYRIGLFSKLTKYAIAGICSFAGLFLLGDLLFGGPDVEGLTLLIGLLISTGMLGFAGYLVWSTTRQAFSHVLVCKTGLIQVNWHNYVTVRWEEIVTVWEAIMDLDVYGLNATTRKFKIQTESGMRLLFDNDLKNVAELGQTIQSKVRPRLLNRALEATSSGETVPFGRIGVCAQGLKYRRSTLAWQDVKRVQLRKGFIKITKKKRWLRWYKARISGFPNLSVFLALIDRIGCLRVWPHSNLEEHSVQVSIFPL